MKNDFGLGTKARVMTDLRIYKMTKITIEMNKELKQDER